MPCRVDFPAVVLKGMVEKNDGSVYFGSLGGYDHYRNIAKKRGWVAVINKKWTVTASGQKWYDESGLSALPRKGRAYMWDNWQFTKKYDDDSDAST